MCFSASVNSFVVALKAFYCIALKYIRFGHSVKSG
jgi:hypothetical protein